MISKTDAPCTLCGDCDGECREAAIELTDSGPVIDDALCLHCGKCLAVCDSGTLGQGLKGFRVQLGGKLGRHPQLARELPGIYSEDAVIEIIQRCIDFYKQHSKAGERFAEIFKAADFERLTQEMRKRAG